MVAALPDFREAIDNTLRIAEMCNVELSLGKSFLPRFQLPDGVSEDEWIEKLAREGLDARFREIDGKYPHDRDQYRQRLEMELGVVEKMGFSGYFLIVQDFINWAKRHNIPVEVVYTSVPLVIVIVLFVVTAVSVRAVDRVRAGSPDVTVDVLAFQWQWQFAYPELDVTVTGTDMAAAFWRLLAIAFSIAAPSLPTACIAPLMTACGV